jgi:glycosyltransferase involved in cell wall biosynthesis
MARIAIDARVINSGTGRYIERLLHYLEEIDQQNEYLVLVRKNDLSYYQPKNPHFQIVEADFADYSLAEQWQFATLLNKLQPDLVHFCMPQQPLRYRGRGVTTIHDLNLLRITSNDDMNPVELRVKKLIFRFLLHRVAHRTAHILTPSQFTKNDLLHFHPMAADKVTVTYESADKVNAKPQPVSAYAHVPFIMYVGRAEPYKNNRGIIAAHQLLLKSNPELRLVIVGRKDVLRQADMRWVEKHGYKNIDFLGFVEDAELAWLYQHCATYVFASFMEGFGLPGLEAMAYGAPVASSNATCLPEVLGEAALYFDPSKPTEIAAAITKIMSDNQLRESLIQQGFQQHAKYSWRRMAEQTYKVYKKALSEKEQK